MAWHVVMVMANFVKDIDNNDDGDNDENEEKL